MSSFNCYDDCQKPVFVPRSDQAALHFRDVLSVRHQL